MAKAKKRSYRRPWRSYRTRARPKMTLPIAVLAGFASPIARAIDHGMAYGFVGSEGAVAELTRTMIGVNPFETPIKFEWWRLRYGLFPIVLGLGVHKAASLLGVNRMLANLRVPLLRV
jgi:hypothetical protein